MSLEKYKYYVGGEFKEGRRIDVVNPANEEIFAQFSEASFEDLNLAIGKAREAQKEWRKVSFKERAKLLREIANAIFENLKNLADLETKEIGKPLKESLFIDIPLGGECFNYYASFLESLEEKRIKTDTGESLLSYEPFGVCGVYLPYNVPLMIFGFSCAGSLAAGNSLIIKPSEYGSLSLLELAKYIDKLDIPKGLINILSGKGDTLGKYLAESDVDLISFTGSRNTLQKIYQTSSKNPKKIICELGGCNPTFVFSDAKRNSCVENILGSSFLKSGQMCIGTSLVLIEEEIYEDFLRELVEKTREITKKIGDPFLPDTGIGALPTREHLDNLSERVKNLEKKGGRILCGGKPLNRKGYFYPPTVIELNKIIYEEFFAPVILVKSFKRKNTEKIMEENPTGLVLQIWTEDLKMAKELAEKANVGTVWINTFGQISPQTPFGGTKLSGWGRNLGSFGFFEYVQIKHTGIGIKGSPVEGWFGID